MVALEAMELARPVIGGPRSGGSAELVQDGVTGLLVPGRKRVGAAGRCDHPARRKLELAARMGEAGRARALELFPPGSAARPDRAALRGRAQVAACAVDGQSAVGHARIR